MAQGPLHLADGKIILAVNMNDKHDSDFWERSATFKLPGRWLFPGVK